MFAYSFEPGGRAEAERDGLYWAVRAECRSLEGLHRLYAADGEAVCCLGVLEPRDGGLSLTRRLSGRRFSFSGDTRLYLDEGPGKAETGSDGAGGCLLTFPYREGEPFPMLGQFRAFRLVRRGGRFCWEAELNQDGTLKK